MLSPDYIGRSQSIVDLRITSMAALSIPDFRSIVWIGVFGSFSRDEQRDKSDVDIIVIEDEDCVAEWGDAVNPDPWTLEDLLPRVWSRPVDIIRIEKQQLRGLVFVDALLTARTIYGDGQCELVSKRRQDARAYLEAGRSLFSNTAEQIKTLRESVMTGRDINGLGDSSFRQCALDHLLRILQGLDIEQKGNPIHEGFWSMVLQLAKDLRIFITSAENNSEYWDRVWQIILSPEPKSLYGLLARLQKHAIPALDDITERIKISERLERGEGGSSNIVTGEGFC